MPIVAEEMKVSLTLSISVDFPDWIKIFKMPIRENGAYLKFAAIITVYLFMLSHYRPYQTSYNYLLVSLFISNYIIYNDCYKTGFFVRCAYCV